MKKQTVFGLVLLFSTMLLAAGLAVGQEVKVAPASEPTVSSGGTLVRTQQTPQPSTGFSWSFVNSEFTFDGKVVKGAPYSAQAITESKQILIDGNKIVNTSTATLYRDSEGRTRREQTLKAIGGLATGAEPLQSIMINDPVGGFSYTLDPATHTARKGSGLFSFSRSGGGGQGGATFSTSGRTTPGENSSGSGSGSGSNQTGASTSSFVWSTSEGGSVTAARRTQPGTPSSQTNNANVENLGNQIFEGVEATGTKTTFTIPAGQIGNDRPIEIVDERWYSKELQMVVMSRHSDPRSGETLYRLINISRLEPDRSLFEVPADYQIKESKLPPPTIAPARRPEN